jgi:hypothetical protein
VWTPKRILLLTAGFFLFFTTYAVYAHFLGGIDGLPALPREYWPSDDPPVIEPWDFHPGDADRKLIQAFGQDCVEVKERTIKLFIKDKGMVLATNEFGIEADGRVKLKPFSIAIFGKDRDSFRFPEINTVRCKEAYLKFDRPITSPTEMGNRKIIGGELRGWTVEPDGKIHGGTIRITNNRHTQQRDDDIQVTISVDGKGHQQPLFYEEEQHKIWTEGTVELLDLQSKPKPTKITAEGMDLFLTTAVPVQGGKPAKKPKGETISGVDRVVLHKNVKMYLQVDARSGFLGNNRASSPQAGKKTLANPDPRVRSFDAREPQEASSPVVIDTEGPFCYNVPKDLATFDIPAPVHSKKDDKKAELKPQVLVFRIHDIGEGVNRSKSYDQLLCDHLELQFRRKANPDPRAARDNRSGDREIESAHATAHPTADDPRKVVLCLDTEGLEANGEDLVYRCGTATKAPQTILKAGPRPTDPPLQAIKDGNIIQARELWLVGGKEKGGAQQATAMGPGRIDLADHGSASSEPRYPVQIYWRDKLFSTKDHQYDVFTLTKEARFVDQDHDQDLQAERIKVWLEPAERTTPEKSGPPTKQLTPAAKGAPRQRPHQVEAFDQVSLHSPEMNIQDTDHLTVMFSDSPLGKDDLPAVLPDVADASKRPANAHATAKQANPPAILKTENGPSRNAPGVATANPAEKEPKKPINLWARSVRAWINRTGPKNELDRMVSRGKVHVHQEGAKPGDKGVDIKGETMELVRQYDGLRRAVGDLLVVWGEPKTKKSAELQLGEMFLVGPKVTIDQKENTAEVQGIGLMDMPSNTSFDGGKATKPGTRLTVQWTKGMLFDGKEANFHGKVNATQENSLLLCEALQVTLDRVVSFKEGQKGGQAAKVEKLVADRQVDIEEKVYEKGKMVKHNRLVCQGLAMDNQEGPIIASGPGVAYLLQPGAVDSDLAGPSSPPGDRSRPGNAPAQRMEMKLTRIEFEGRMFSNNKRGNRIATFLDKVEVSNLPAEKMDAPFNKDQPPERGMYLSSEILKVYTSPPAVTGGKANQTLIAEKNVLVRTPDSFARAAKVTFDEAKDLIIFKGVPGTPATFTKIPPPGGVPQGFKGQEIFYNRKTKQHMGEGLQSISVE